MLETLIKTRNAAESPTQVSNRDYRPANDASLIPEKDQTAAPAAHLTCGVVVVSSSESDPANWITTTDSPDQIRVIPPDAEVHDFFLSATEAQFIQQTREDIAQLPDENSSSPAADCCKKFAEGVGIALAHQARTRCAVFADEDGEVTLVAHSRTCKRQVSFEFRADGSSINLVSIDADMQLVEKKCLIDDVETLGCAIAWLNPR